MQTAHKIDIERLDKKVDVISDLLAKLSNAELGFEFVLPGEMIVPLAAALSGFSITGAVSTNTLSSEGACSTMKRASAFSAFLTVL